MPFGWIALVMLLAIASPVWGLDPRLAITQFGHQVLTVADGLPQDSLRSMAQTTDGYMWFAGVSGLARFDGVHFTVFDSSNTPALAPPRIISAVAPGPDGSLWVGRVGGPPLRYQRGVFQPLATPSMNCRALLLDSRGVLWIGADRALYRYAAGHLTKAFEGGYEVNVHNLLEWPAGTMWVAANNGLHRFEGQSHRVYTLKDGLPDLSVVALAPAGNGAIWVGTHTGGLSRFSDGRFGR